MGQLLLLFLQQAREQCLLHPGAHGYAQLNAQAHLCVSHSPSSVLT